MTVLTFADAWDPHVDKVDAHLRALGIDHHRVDLDVDSLRQTRFSLIGDDARITTPRSSFDLNEVRGVWARRLNVALSLQEEHHDHDSSFQIWRNEWNRHLYWIFDALRDSYWLNPLIKGGMADNKHLQMRIANKVGFSIPDTISSNYKDDLIEFSRNKNDIAIKFISQKTVSKDGEFLGLYVHKIPKEELRDFSDLGEPPVVLQAYIEKDFEVRYTYVGGDHHVCKIDSQASAKASVDWRRYDLGNTPHEAIDPPPQVKEAVEAMMQQLGIDYGALDFIVDPNGTWWFLEINSNGQWLWIEELTGLAISQSIATLLANRSGG